MTASPLIHIGFHKTGTTWLQEQVFADNRYGFTRVWPRTIIDDAWLGGNPFTFDPQRAAALFAPFAEEAAASGTVLVVSHEPLCGQLDLNGYDSQVNADRIYATYPHARILIVIREQRSMLASVYKQIVTTSGTSSAKRMWRDYSPEERRRPVPGLEVFEYHHLIDYYQRLFGKDRVLVLPFELLNEDTERFVKTICSFVDLPSPSDVPDVQENVSTPAALIGPIRLSNFVLRAFGLAAPFGGDVTRERIRYLRFDIIRSLGARIPAVLSRPFERGLAKMLRRIAEGRFAESNRITSDITGLDLGSLGYHVAPRAAAGPGDRAGG